MLTNNRKKATTMRSKKTLAEAPRARSTQGKEQLRLPRGEIGSHGKAKATIKKQPSEEPCFADQGRWGIARKGYR